MLITQDVRTAVPSHACYHCFEVAAADVDEGFPATVFEMNLPSLVHILRAPAK